MHYSNLFTKFKFLHFKQPIHSTTAYKSAPSLYFAFHSLSMLCPASLGDFQFHVSIYIEYLHLWK